MDYAQEVTLAELKPKFKGLLTSLLADAFYEEEYLECPTEHLENSIQVQKSKPIQQLGFFIKPFT